MFIAMNRFRIALGKEDDFVAHWRNRNSYLSEVPGFVSFNLLRGDTNEERTRSGNPSGPLQTGRSPMLFARRTCRPGNRPVISTSARRSWSFSKLCSDQCSRPSMRACMRMGT